MHHRLVAFLFILLNSIPSFAQTDTSLPNQGAPVLDANSSTTITDKLDELKSLITNMDERIDTLQGDMNALKAKLPPDAADASKMPSPPSVAQSSSGQNYKNGWLVYVHPIVTKGRSIVEQPYIGIMTADHFPISTDFHREKYPSDQPMLYKMHGLLKINQAGLHIFSLFIDSAGTASNCRFTMTIEGTQVFGTQDKTVRKDTQIIHSSQLELEPGLYEIDMSQSCDTKSGYGGDPARFDLRILRPGDRSPSSLTGEDVLFVEAD